LFFLEKPVQRQNRMTFVPNPGRRWPVATTLATTLALATLGSTAARADAPTPTFAYAPGGALVDANGGSTLTPSSPCPGDPCVDTAVFGTDATGPYWQWTSSDARGGGLRLATNAPLGDTYTVILKFSFSQTGSGYNKIIDYKDRVSDTGFYFLNGQILFYNLGSASTQTFANDEVLDLIVVRQATVGLAGQFTVYAKTPTGGRVTLIDITDPSGQSIPEIVNGNSILGFFYDDTATSSEATPGGKLYALRGWANVALTPAEIDTVVGPSVQTPGAPTDIAVTPSSGGLSIAFSAPADAGSDPITAYEYSLDGGVTWNTTSATSSPIVVTGLTNGTTYQVAVRAVSAAGAGTPSTTVVGTPTAPGAPLVHASTEPVGPHCAHGGVKVEVGNDNDDDGELDADEVTDTAYVCNAADGSSGDDGSPGDPGSSGTDGAVGGTGATGASGPDGRKALVTTRAATVEECGTGGTVVVTGIDDDGNGTLDPAEVDSSASVCNGADAFVDGDTDGVDDRVELAGASCNGSGSAPSVALCAAGLALVLRRRRRA
jgi:hypothetical protein